MTKILLEKKIDQMTLKLKKDQNYHKTQKMTKITMKPKKWLKYPEDKKMTTWPWNLEIDQNDLEKKITKMTS